MGLQLRSTTGFLDHRRERHFQARKNAFAQERSSLFSTTRAFKRQTLKKKKKLPFRFSWRHHMRMKRTKRKREKVKKNIFRIIIVIPPFPVFLTTRKRKRSKKHTIWEGAERGPNKIKERIQLNFSMNGRAFFSNCGEKRTRLAGLVFPRFFYRTW